MKSSLLRPSRICGIWWTMAEKMACQPVTSVHSWQTQSLETGFTLADSRACRVRVLCVFVCKSCWSQAENWYLWCAWEPPCHLSLRAVTAPCLWAAWRCGGCVSGRSTNVNTAALYLSELGFSWEKGTAHRFARVQDWGPMKLRKPDIASLTIVTCTDTKNPSFSVGVATLVFFIVSALIPKRTLGTKKKQPLIWNKWKAWRD